MVVCGCWAAYPRKQKYGLLECKHGQGQLVRTPTAMEENGGRRPQIPRGPPGEARWSGNAGQ
eukprot:5456332-Pyramimonas_sp.AAC.1